MTARSCSCPAGGCDRICAARVPIFQDLAPRELARFDDILLTRYFADGSLIYSQGSPAQMLCIVNTGAVKLYKTTPEGREQVLRLLGAGDFFGEAVLFGEHQRSASAQALGPCRICQLDKAQAEAIIYRNPTIAHKLIAALNLRLLKAEDQIESLGARTTLQRVAKLLTELAEEQGSLTVTLPLSREGLANFTGMTVENLSRKLGELQQLGLIRPQGRKKIILLDPDALAALI